VPKGTPKNQKLVDEMLYRLCKLELREKDSRDSQDKRIAALEARIAEMNEAFSRATFPRAPIPTLYDAVQ
jgi:hypothetical protein